jgi:hypothetical protein
MKLVWSNTGDEIEVVPSYQKLCDLYLDVVHDKNTFFCAEQTIDVDHIQSYNNNLSSVLEQLAVLGIAHQMELGEPFDQQHLNRQHRAWVALQQKYPRIAEVLGNSVEQWHALNKSIHACEEMWQQTWKNKHSNWLAPNPYKNLLSFSINNVRIHYADLGRNTFNKFINYDNELGSDTSDFDQLSGEIIIDLNRPIDYTPPTSYIRWCLDHGLKDVPGRCLNLGNIKDLEARQEDYRRILFRNTGNTMSVVH